MRATGGSYVAGARAKATACLRAYYPLAHRLYGNRAIHVETRLLLVVSLCIYKMWPGAEAWLHPHPMPCGTPAVSGCGYRTRPLAVAAPRRRGAAPMRKCLWCGSCCRAGARLGIFLIHTAATRCQIWKSMPKLIPARTGKSTHHVWRM